jgi:hypothetical protein
LNLSCERIEYATYVSESIVFANKTTDTISISNTKINYLSLANPDTLLLAPDSNAQISISSPNRIWFTKTDFQSLVSNFEVVIKENKQKEDTYKMAVRNIENWERKSEYVNHFYNIKDFTIEHYFTFTE